MKYLFLLFLVACSASTPVPAPPIITASAVVEARAYGLTLDSVDSGLTDIVASLKGMPSRPVVRIVFDYPRPAKDFLNAVKALSAVATVVGQPSDSEYNSKMTVDAYRARFKDFISTMPMVDVWEVCNECNGDWLGANAIKQATAALEVVKAAGKKGLYTAYWNTTNCKDTHGEWGAWHTKNLTDYLKKNITYATLSVYGYDCDGPEPTYSVLDKELAKLQGFFPGASVMIGEYGKQGSAAVMRHYLNYPKKGWGLYWFGRQDLVPKTKPLFKIFSE